MPETTKQNSLLELKTWEGGSGKKKEKKRKNDKMWGQVENPEGRLDYEKDT